MLLVWIQECIMQIPFSGWVSSGVIAKRQKRWLIASAWKTNQTGGRRKVGMHFATASTLNHLRSTCKLNIFFLRMSAETLILLPIPGRIGAREHNTSPTWYSQKITGKKASRKINHYFHPVPYHYYWHRTFSEQLVIEFGGLMASSTLSIDAVQNHYSDFLEMNHLWTPLPRDKKKKWI